MGISLKPKHTFTGLLAIILIGGVLAYFFLNPFSAESKPNIIIILIDALRSDHLGCYGYPRDTSPHIDKIASQGILFSNYYSVSSWTNPAITSLFTGFYPQSILPAERHMEALQQALPDVQTLAEILSQAGYRTISLNDHPAINKRLGYDRGFDSFNELWQEPGWHQDWGGVHPDMFVEEVSRELQLGTTTNKPFFLFLHILYPHAPYNPPPPYDTFFGERHSSINPRERGGMINVYDGEIRYTDNLIGRLFELLREKEYLGKTYIVITSDHGEGFYEHGMWEHGNTLYNEVLHVPLIIFPPGGRVREPKQVSFLAGSVDLFPTILDMADMDPPAVDGESLFRFFRSNNSKVSVNTIFSESCYSFCVESMAMQNVRYKVILHKDKEMEVFDKYTDPLELKNIALGMNTSALKALENRVLQHKIMNDERRKNYKTEKTQLNQEAIQKIKSLGYLQ